MSIMEVNHRILFDIAYAAMNGQMYSVTRKASYGANPTKHVDYYGILGGHLRYLNSVFEDIEKRKRDKNGSFVLVGGGTNVVADYYWGVMHKIADKFGTTLVEYHQVQELNI